VVRKPAVHQIRPCWRPSRGSPTFCAVRWPMPGQYHRLRTLGEFELADAEELVRYATRRGLLGRRRETGSLPRFTRPNRSGWTRRGPGAGPEGKRPRQRRNRSSG